MTNHQSAGDKAAFRQRCQYALLHPVTLGALGILLLNDLVLKGLWANPWTTGKLSDLAWVVFASPLLAYLLSLAAPGGRRTQRAIWIAAYLGLPLLYAAFNTFAPLHDAILRGLSLVSGGVGGSPLDATDSLVIPLGLAIALWVWQRGRTTRPISRQHIAMAAAGLAVFASVATSYPAPNYGVIRFETTSQGRLVTNCNGGYETVDGGLTWQSSSHYGDSYYEYILLFTIEDVHKEIYTTRGNHILNEYGSVVTPRGEYAINERGVTHTVTTSQLVYSTGYLRSSGEQWIQKDAVLQLWPYREDAHIAISPYDIIYDATSGNVIVAMGIQGVVVGTPDGKWTRVAVGFCQPTDFSFSSKANTLLNNNGLRILFLYLPLAIVTFAVSIAAIRISTPDESKRRISASVIAIFLVSIASLGVEFLPWPNSGFLVLLRYLPMPVIALAVSLAVSIMIIRISMPAGARVRSLALIAAAVLAAFAALVAGLLLWMLGAYPGEPPLATIAAFMLMAIGLALVLTAFALCIKRFANKRFLFGASAVAALALSAQVFLALLVWVNSDFSPLFVKISVILMAVLTGYALQHYLTRKERAAVLYDTARELDNDDQR